MMRSVSWWLLLLLMLLTDAATDSHPPPCPPVDDDTTSPWQPQEMPKQIRVAPEQLVTVLVPLFPSPDEIGYLLNQLRTFISFFNTSSVYEYLIVSVTKGIDEVAAALDDFFETHKHMAPQTLFRIIPEQYCTSELQAAHGHPREGERNWNIQQLVKLSCAKVIRSPFYLVLDVDVWWSQAATVTDLFFTRPCTPQSLVCNQDGTLQYRTKQSMTYRGDSVEALEDNFGWIAGSCSALNVSQPSRQHRYSAGVTPQFLATDVAVMLQEYIMEKIQSPEWEKYLMDLIVEKVEWSEYTLYWIFGWHIGLWPHYHSPFAAHKMVSWGSKEMVADNPCEFFRQDTPGYWSWAQSQLKIPPQALWEMIKPCIQQLNRTVVE